DRRALLALGGPELAPRAEHVAPRTPVEESLAAIWAEVLKLPQVGVYDNFFEIGGQSLLATQVISRVREVFRVELPVRVLFQRPEVAGLAEAVEEAALAGRGIAPAPPIVPVPRGGELPLSFSQERLWFIDRLRPGITAYNIFGAVRMRGDLDVAVLESCFDELARRHEVLRTTFTEINGRPSQIINPPSSIRVPLVDLTALPEEGRHALAQRLGNEEAQRPFDLVRGPLLRGVLLRIGGRDHLLALTAHHIVYDVWSRELLVRELGTLYEAFWHGRPSPLPVLPVQYADFASWQRSWMQGDVLAAQLNYWKEKLAGLSGGSELPGDRPRPAVQSFRGARALLELPAEVTAALSGVARKSGATLFMALLAGFYGSLRRMTGDDDVAVGTPIANRNRAETEGLIGFFVNTLVFRASAAGDPTFRELLARTRETALGGYSHQDVAFEQLVNELKPRRDTSRQPMFQILFNFLTNYRPVVMELPGLVLSPEPNHSGATQFDLILSMYELDGSLHFSADYSSDLYDAPTMARMLGQYANVLADAARRPDVRLSRIALVGEPERHQLLREWDDTEHRFSSQGLCIHHLFAAQAAATPEAPAVSAGGTPWTYAELDRRSSALAASLRRLGVGPETRVGLYLERSPEIVAALLAVLKAGGAYVPLDPSYPEDRLRFMLEHSGARVVVTQPSLSGRLGGAVQELTLGPGTWDASPIEGEEPYPDPEHLAYLIYTSGSTGRPKGVMVNHRTLVASTLARMAYYKEVPRSFLLLSSFAFDSSVAGIFGTLCTGGKLVVSPPGLAENPERLTELIRHEEVSDFLCVPSLYSHLVERPELADIRGVVVAGEACPADLVDLHFRLHPRAGLWNEYGPTEGTVWSSVYAFRPWDRLERVPIGRPIAGVLLYVLDEAGEVAPLGVPGELFVGGACVARGYEGRPELTAEKFVPDPFGPEPGGRLYRTGDLVRYLPGGDLLFLGRIDQQVKVRGYRIELEEIEAVLRQHQALREAVVVPLEARKKGAEAADTGAPQYQRLAAYVVARQGEPAPQAAALRAFLKERLPEYMIPHGIVVLPELPLSPNGKVDRRALAAAGGEAFAPTVPYVAPRNAMEGRLVEIWKELLEVDRVGVQDSFFDLGGHSLLTTRLISRVRDAFQVEVPLQTFFEEPTVAGLGQSIELARWAEEVAREAPATVGAEGYEEGEI
ncbi:MAG TPA: amino acid adenylation domain-containing protein, partial [Thermoanaerobaculia bacterium]|nr:amino acid adenylation domain-containing protein [Thermoanaerobaculia bacterium]